MKIWIGSSQPGSVEPLAYCTCPDDGLQRIALLVGMGLDYRIRGRNYSPRKDVPSSAEVCGLIKMEQNARVRGCRKVSEVTSGRTGCQATHIGLIGLIGLIQVSRGQKAGSGTSKSVQRPLTNEVDLTEVTWNIRIKGNREPYILRFSCSARGLERSEEYLTKWKCVRYAVPWGPLQLDRKSEKPRAVYQILKFKFVQVSFD